MRTFIVVNNQNTANSPKMNDNVDVACGSDLGSSQINEPVLSIHDMGTTKI